MGNKDSEVFHRRTPKAEWVGTPHRAVQALKSDQELRHLLTCTSLAPSLFPPHVSCVLCLHRPAFSPPHACALIPQNPCCKTVTTSQFSCPAETDQYSSVLIVNSSGNLILLGSGVHSWSNHLRAEPPGTAATLSTWALPPDSPASDPDFTTRNLCQLGQVN